MFDWYPYAILSTEINKLIVANRSMSTEPARRISVFSGETDEANSGMAAAEATGSRQHVLYGK